MAEKKITRADGTPVTAAPTAKKTEKAATEAKTETAKKVKKADGTTADVKPAAPVKEEGSATGLRIGAIILWVAAIAFEVVAVLVLFGKITITFMPTLALIIIALVLDLACVSAGSVLWKKANRIDPASEANKVKFWLWNNMGLIVTAFAFIPFVILSLTNKNADKKTKTIATIVAVVALLIGGLVGYDWNPISLEEKEAAVETLTGTDVYWSPFGHVYHTSSECSHLNNSDSLTVGTVEQAIEANRTRLCKTCAARDNIVIDADAAKSDDSGLAIADDENTDTTDELTDENNDLVIAEDEIEEDTIEAEDETVDDAA